MSTPSFSVVSVNRGVGRRALQLEPFSRRHYANPPASGSLVPCLFGRFTRYGRPQEGFHLGLKSLVSLGFLSVSLRNPPIKHLKHNLKNPSKTQSKGFPPPGCPQKPTRDNSSTESPGFVSIGIAEPGAKVGKPTELSASDLKLESCQRSTPRGLKRPIKKGTAMTARKQFRGGVQILGLRVVCGLPQIAWGPSMSFPWSTLVFLVTSREYQFLRTNLSFPIARPQARYNRATWSPHS